MEQNAPTTTPTTNNTNQKSQKGWKIATIITSIIAIGGIGFGIYGMIQSSQKDNQISDLKVQIENPDGEITTLETEKIETTDEDGTTITIADSTPIVSGLYTVGNVSIKRKYYLGVTDLDPAKDTREKDTYIIDTTQLGSKDGIRQYDLKPLLDKAVSDRVANLPDVLAAGTTNATPKSSCQSYKIIVDDPANGPSNSIDWTASRDWSKTLPLTLSMSCINNDTELSLGTGLYSLDPNTNELTMLIETIY